MFEALDFTFPVKTDRRSLKNTTAVESLIGYTPTKPLVNITPGKGYLVPLQYHKIAIIIHILNVFEFPGCYPDIDCQGYNELIVTKTDIRWSNVLLSHEKRYGLSRNGITFLNNCSLLLVVEKMFLFTNFVVS